IDTILSFWLAGIIFTLVAASGVVNAFNLIDGLNGLAGFTGMFVAISLSFVAFQIIQLIDRYHQITNYRIESLSVDVFGYLFNGFMQRLQFCFCWLVIRKMDLIIFIVC
ncbi:MAG: hypothetical protein EBY39_09750, partial [Flavobacteriia bacterium]|nr:hypothetical protein [Flavobacteriia bacterium]